MSNTSLRPVKRLRLSGRNFAFGFAIVATVVALVSGPALAATPQVFSDIPSKVPGNVVSEAFEATGSSEFGDLIQLAPGERSSAKLPVTIMMSSWGCKVDTSTECTTPPGATWDQVLTLNLYSVTMVGGIPTVDEPPLLSKTQTFAIPYRPSADPADCSGSREWYSAPEGDCHNGIAHAVTFTLPSGVTLPDELVWGVAFNTEHYGYAPTGESGPWNSLNVGADTLPGQPAVGVDVEPDGAFLNSLNADSYSDNGLGGTGTFRYDPAGWADYEPMACFGTCPVDYPSSTPTPTASPTASASGGTPSPIESIEGATGTPGRVTPPPTNAGSTPSGESSPVFAILICLASGALGLAAVRHQRRALRR